jgi:predicted small lipoprotein YifL
MIVRLPLFDDAAMRMRRLTILLLLAANLLAACGTKGSLYMPTEEERRAADLKQKR